MKKIFILGCISYILIGLAHLVIGSVLIDYIASYDKQYSDGGTLIFLQFSGYLIGVLGAPFCTSLLSRRGALMLACGCLCAAEFVYGIHPPWGFVLSVAPLAGLGFGMIEAVIGALVIEVAADHKAVAFSRLEAFFGVGALIMPLSASWLIHIGWWEMSFFAISFLALLMLLCWGVLPFGQEEEHLRKSVKVQSSTPLAPKLPLLQRETNAVLSLFIIIYFLYVGGEIAFVSFMPSILMIQSHISIEAATIGNTLFWVMMAIGRIFAGKLADRISFASYLLWSSGVTLLLFAGLLATINPLISFVVVALLGLSMSGMFAIGLVYAEHLIPGRTERLTSILIAAGGIGGALFPLLSGWVLDHMSVSSMQLMLMIISLLMFVAIMSVIRVSRNNNNLTLLKQGQSLV